jgi:hypothetical protein
MASRESWMRVAVPSSPSVCAEGCRVPVVVGGDDGGDAFVGGAAAARPLFMRGCEAEEKGKRKRRMTEERRTRRTATAQAWARESSSGMYGLTYDPTPQRSLGSTFLTLSETTGERWGAYDPTRSILGS